MDFNKFLAENIRLVKYIFRNKVLNTKIIFILLGCIIVLYAVFLAPPEKFPTGLIFKVEEGETLSSITNKLYSVEAIRSPRFFKSFLIVTFNQDELISGEYLLHSPENALKIINRLTDGNFGFDIEKITIPEGSASHDMANIFGPSFIHFKKDVFITLAEKREGYLFPDTYFFYPTAKAEDIIDVLTKTFDEKIKPFAGDIKNSKRSFKDIVIMASIIEREALREKDRAIVSGILWKRIDIDMPLQVDAPFAYISNKSTYELTTEDLRKDSPYNTYTRRGLTPTPISNPGLSSIRASIFPAKSNYLYYLSDKSGTIHYAETFEGHKLNRQKYLNK